MFRIKSYYCKKGYDKLLKNKNLKFVRDIKNSLMLTTVLADTSKYFYNRELSLRQYLLSYFGLQRLERSILFFLGSGLSIKFLPLTGSQLKVLRSHGIKASWFWTKFSLISFLIYIHFKAIYFRQTQGLKGNAVPRMDNPVTRDHENARAAMRHSCEYQGK